MIAMASFPSEDPIWEILAAIDDEPTGEFSELVKAAQLDPKVDFRNAFLVKLSFKGADISGFDFSGSDLRGSGLRYAANAQGVVISKATRLDPADPEWWNRERAKREEIVNAPERLRQQATSGPWRGGALAAAGSPFRSSAEAATSIRQADLLILTFLFLIMIGG
jgi:Pentapeptide repeats (8 copies)